MKSPIILSLIVLAVAATTAGFVVSSTEAQSRPKAQSRAYLHSYNLPASGVAIDGYCPVAYFTAGKPVKGQPNLSASHNGVTYYLASEGAKKLFEKEPKKYLPAYGGWCAFGMSKSDKFPIDPTCFKIVDGQLLLFLRNAGVDAKDIWNSKNEKKLLSSAGAFWKKVQG